MSNRFLEKKAYLEGLSTTAARARSSTLTRAASRGRQVTSIASRNRFGFSGPMSTDERVLVVLMENGGIDLGVGTLIDHLLGQVPGSSVIPQSARDALVRYVDERIKSATDNLLENAELVLNRYSAAAPQYYGSVLVLRNGSALYSSLKDTLIQLTEANKFIDLFVLTHGSSDRIALQGSDIDGNKIREIKTVHNGGRPVRLRSVYMMNCVGASLNQAWIDIGAKVSAGSIRNNYIPEPTMYYFFNNWKENKSFNDSVLDAYQRTIDTIESIITTGLRVAMPGTNLIPGFDRLVESIADIENRQFIQDSAPVITGNGLVKISSDTLSFGQSMTTRSFAFVPISRSRGRTSLPRTMQAPERIMSHQMSQQAIDFIKSFEDFRANLYNDPVGHCSIGYGHLVHRGNCDGRASESEFINGITEARATDMLRTHITGVEAVVNEAVEVQLNQHQFDALVSFAYNVGTGRRGTASQEGTGFLGSTLLRRLNAGEYDAVPAEMARWNKAGGRVLPGLTRRRAAEGRMFASGDYSIGQSMGFGHFVRGMGGGIALAGLGWNILNAAITNSRGDITWELQRMEGAKHPNDDQSTYNVGPWSSQTLRVPTPTAGGLIDDIVASFELDFRYNNHSVGFVEARNVNTNDAVGWGLDVNMTMMPEPRPKSGTTDVAELKVTWTYRFHRTVGSDVIYTRHMSLFGDGTFTDRVETHQASALTV